MKNAAHLLPVQVNLVRPLWCDCATVFCYLHSFFKYCSDVSFQDFSMNKIILCAFIKGHFV